MSELSVIGRRKMLEATKRRGLERWERELREEMMEGDEMRWKGKEDWESGRHWIQCFRMRFEKKMNQKDVGLAK